MDKSFGIQVAKLAGLPDDLIERAKAILSELETSDINNAASKVSSNDASEQISLLGRASAANGTEEKDAIINDLSKMDVERMTPLEALAKLYEISARAKLLK